MERIESAVDFELSFEPTEADVQRGFDYERHTMERVVENMGAWRWEVDGPPTLSSYAVRRKTYVMVPVVVITTRPAAEELKN
jgi:hypothetical protein